MDFEEAIIDSVKFVKGDRNTLREDIVVRYDDSSIQGVPNFYMKPEEVLAWRRGIVCAVTGDKIDRELTEEEYKTLIIGKKVLTAQERLTICKIGKNKDNLFGVDDI